jgi:hypothetical protein
MSRLHRIAPTVAATLAAAALLAPVAQARPAAFGGADNAPTVERTVHDQPLANPVALPATGLNHGGGLALDRTRSTRITSSTSTDWVDVFSGAAASALVIAMCAAGIGLARRANPAT